MATTTPIHGYAGEVYFNATAGSAAATKIAGIREFTHRITADEADGSAGGDTVKTTLVGLAKHEGEFGGIWEMDDSSGQAALSVGDRVEIALRPAGDTATETELTGTVEIMSIEYDWSFEGVPGFRCSYVCVTALVVQDIPT